MPRFYLHAIIGAGLFTGPVPRGNRTFVWADDGFGNLRIVDRHAAYCGLRPHGFVANEPFAAQLR